MSHPEQTAYFAALAAANAPLVRGARVLEIGSYDVNGTFRSLFAAASEYIGVDLTDGPGVDVVAYGHEYANDEPFDIVISGECFEHDPHWAQTLTNMIRLTRPGGLVAFSCASRGRPEHGTRRSLVDYSPGTQSQGLDYYRNLDANDVTRAIDLATPLSQHRFWYVSTNFDLYFAGVVAGMSQPGDVMAQIPDGAIIDDISAMMSSPHRALRFPLRAARRLISDDERYQRVILPYWLSLLRVRNAVQKRMPNAPGLADRGQRSADVDSRLG